MNDKKKAKWILGTSGIVVCALVLSQLNDNNSSVSAIEDPLLLNEQIENISNREKELLNLDWTNFEIISLNQQRQSMQSDRRTKRS